MQAILLIIAAGALVGLCWAFAAAGRSYARTKANRNPQLVIREYGAFIENRDNSPLKIEDVSALPYPKDVILEALLWGVTPGQAERNEQLHVCAMPLAQYQTWIGREPLYAHGFDMDEMLRQQSPAGGLKERHAQAIEMTQAFERGREKAARFDEFNKIAQEDLRRINDKFEAAKARLKD